MKGKKRICIFGVSLMALAGSLAAGCAAPPAAAPAATPAAKTPETAPAARPSPAPATVGKVKMHVTQKSVSWLNFYLGKEQGIYKAEGIDLELVELQATLGLASVMSGDIDYTGIVSPVVIGGFQGAPVKLLLGTITRPPWYLVAAPEINSFADLKGKVIGLPSIGATAYDVTKMAIKQKGLDPDKDVTYLAVAGGVNQMAALRSKSVAAVAMVAPFHQQAADEGAKVLVFTGDIVDLPIDGVSATVKRIKDNPGAVKAMVRATLKSLRYIPDHRQESIAWMKKELNLDDRTAGISYDDAVKGLSLDGAISEKGIQFYIDQGKASGALKGTSFPHEQVADFSFLKDIQKELGIAR